MDKKEIRSQIRAIKKSLGAETLLAKSAPLADRLATDPHYVSSDIVMLYYPLWDEPDTRSAITMSLNLNKRVILPTVVGDDIVPVEVTSGTQWLEGPFGIMEPQADPYNGDIDFILVPGVAFTRTLSRLGRGRGYYDRFLSLHPSAYRLGVCFDFQIVPSLPLEPHDLPMQNLITL